MAPTMPLGDEGTVTKHGDAPTRLWRPIRQDWPVAGRLASRLCLGGCSLLAVVAALGAATSLGPTVTAADAGEPGAFFTLGFKGSDRTFVLLAQEQKAIRELRADLSKPRSERRIVSGIVRTGKPYNQPWSYTMGSRSIVLGQVFTEVCDASPTYVPVSYTHLTLPTIYSV